MAPSPGEIREAVFRTRRGNEIQVHHREGTTDWETLNACITEDEYGLAERFWQGTALDVGAHVGGATLSLLADNPGVHVVAIEALPMNASLIRENVELNGWQGRCTIYTGAASRNGKQVTVAYGTEGERFETAHRFIGGAVWQDTGPKGLRVRVPGITLQRIVQVYGFLSLMKIDCEGCEWAFLDSPVLDQVGEIRGEVHPRDGKRATDIRALLERTHSVTVDDTADWGLFRAVLR